MAIREYLGVDIGSSGRTYWSFQSAADCVAKSPTAYGRILREARIKRGLTQTDVATALGMHPPRISSLETSAILDHESASALSACARFLGADEFECLFHAKKTHKLLVGETRGMSHFELVEVIKFCRAVKAKRNGKEDE